MNNIVEFLKSERPLFLFSLFLLLTYAVNMSFLMFEAGHVSLGHVAIDRIFYFLMASALEGVVLMLIINGKDLAGKIFAITAFFINIIYYNHFLEDVRLMVASILLSGIHSAAIFFMSELFARKTEEDEENDGKWKCQICLAKFDNEKQLVGHISAKHPEIVAKWPTRKPRLTKHTRKDS
jgi:hypothetical protein